MKKKNIIIWIILIVIAVSAIIMGIHLRNKKTLSGLEEEIDNFTPDTTIVSTKENKIEKDGLEVTEIGIAHMDSSLDIRTHLKNNSKKEKSDFMIRIELLDKDNNVVTSVSKRIGETIKPGEEYIIKSSVVGYEQINEITSARISHIIQASNPKEDLNLS